MYFLGLAADFDGTIAHDGVVENTTRAALIALKQSGRRLILVTGRELADLAANFPDYGLFDRLVLENGAVLHDPASAETRLLAPPPDPVLVQLLRGLGVERLSVGQAIIAAWEPDQAKVLDAIRQSGLELQITFNKGALMVLPTGINKASGLRAAARELGLSPGALVGVGDAENDHSFLAICGCSAAVANAVPSIKAEADLVLGQDHGAGVRFLAEALQQLDGDLLPSGRHGLAVGTSRSGKRISIPCNEGNVLVVGPSQIGKSTLATMLIEQMLAHDYGFAVLDPEGDYHSVRGTSVIDASHAAISLADFEMLLAAELNPVVLLRGMKHEARRRFMLDALAAATARRERSGAPAFVIIDEAHQGFATHSDTVFDHLPCVIFITVSPRLLSAPVLASIGTVCALGASAEFLLKDFCSLAGIDAPAVAGAVAPGPGEMLVWRPNFAAVVVRPDAPRQAHVRHAGKYATGDVGDQRSFYFRGAENRICVQARNLFDFLAKGDAVPDEVWDHHLANGDMSRWFAAVIRDADLVAATEAIRQAGPCSAAVSRARLRAEIAERYCLPAMHGAA